MIKITADSTCDLSAKIIDDLNITLAPLLVLIDNKVFHDGVDIVPADIIRYVEEEGKTCKTAAFNVYEYECLFEKYSSAYDAVIHICIGSGFSSCFQNATIAAGNFKNVYIINSQNLTSGSGHLVYEAACMAQSGAGAEEICRSITELIPRVNASFVIDRMDYLYKGGRCSGLEMVGAKILSIKPCIEVVNGKMTVGKKYKGSFERCLEQYIKDRLTIKRDIDYSRVFITHSMCSPQTNAKVRETLLRYAHFEDIIETPAGCTVSSHCGPNTLGILFKHVKSR